MVKTVFQLFKFILTIIIKNLYWIFRLFLISKGKGFKCGFPVIVEGKGDIKLGADVSFESGVNIGCGHNASLNFGDKCRLDSKLLLSIGGKARVRFGNNVHLEGCTKMYANNDWDIGDNVVVASGGAIFAREPGMDGKFIVGAGTHIGNNTIIDLSENVVIGENVAVGPNTIIYTHDHDYKENKDVPWKGSPVRKQVIIENGAWIGANVILLPGVVVESGALVAAGAVVTKSVVSRTIVGGVPARLIGQNQ
jgi:acetyltransferase-like isoleucine patch superfamily enzyme